MCWKLWHETPIEDGLKIFDFRFQGRGLRVVLFLLKNLKVVSSSHCAALILFEYLRLRRGDFFFFDKVVVETWAVLIMSTNKPVILTESVIFLFSKTLNIFNFNNIYKILIFVLYT